MKLKFKMYVYLLKGLTIILDTPLFYKNIILYNFLFFIWKGDGKMIKGVNVGDIVEMKKQHPCGSNQWKVIRIGADIKIKCMGCERIIMLPRGKFEKGVKKIIEQNQEI